MNALAFESKGLVKQVKFKLESPYVEKPFSSAEVPPC